MALKVVKAGFDLASVSMIAGALLDVLPKIAAGLSVIWYVYCMTKEVIRLHKEKRK